MAEYSEVMRQRNRMCSSLERGCDECPFNNNNNGCYDSCADFIVRAPDFAEEIIMKWAKENPETTQKEDGVNKNG